MADALLAAILGRLAAITAKEARQRVSLLANVEDEVGKIEHNLRAIKVVLDDAEEKQFGNKRLELWLDRLKEEAFEIEDVLDDWSAALLKLQMRERDNGASSKVLSCLSRCFYLPSQVVWRYDIASKIKQISSRLDEIAKQKKDYDLAERPEKLVVLRVSRETTSFDDDVSMLYGRDEIKEDIINCLLPGEEECESEIVPISIFGMGGIGKTALAQLVYNESRVERFFGENRIWVCVSDTFNVKNVAKAIIASLEDLERDRVYSLESLPLQHLLERICRSIEGKKFCMVLDDVWEDNMQNWQRLMGALKHGARGSRILLTTRKETVAKMLNYSHVFPMEKLSDEHCWDILSQLAFFGRDEEERQRLKDVGRMISDRCRGLPLAAKTLGNLLRSKSSIEEWEAILNSEIWKLKVAQREIFTPLLLSYFDLPSTVRQCFRFCVIYPKDEIYWQIHQVYYWMSQGYLELDGTHEELELKGVEYLKLLVSRSFFQDIVTYDQFNGLINCKMHDIVHDFGQFLTKDEVVIKVVGSEENPIVDLSSKARHLTLFISEGSYPHISINGAEKLHSLSASNSITTDSLRTIFNQAKKLRMIDLRWLGGSSCTTNESIPKEIRNLIHLKYLSLAGNHHRKELPSSMRKLCHLQYLDLTDNTALEILPDWIAELVSLRFLRTSVCFRLSHYPKSLMRLTNLREVHGAMLRADGDDPEQFGLGDLESMDQLRIFRFTLKGNAIDAAEVQRAKFQNKPHLKDLGIYLPAGDMGRDYVMQALNLPSNINLHFMDSSYA